MRHDQYSAINALNWTTLRYIATSPLLYRYRLTHPEPDKPAWALGRAIHCAILEPGEFPARYAFYDGVRRGREWQAWQEDHPDCQSLKPDEAAVIEACAAAVRAHPYAGPFLEIGRHEEVITWSRDGLQCKGRLDCITPQRVIDLKTTKDPLPRLFARDAARYLYHGQIAWYHDGAIASGALASHAAGPPMIVAVQTVEPYDVAVYFVSEATLEAGRALVRRLIDRLAACQAADIWPGVAPEPVWLELPRWADERDEEEVLG